MIFRGLVDVLAHRFIPAPTIYGAEYELAKDDVISRRRLWYWRKKFRRTFFWGSLFLLVSLIVVDLRGRRPRRRDGGRADRDPRVPRLGAAAARLPGRAVPDQLPDPLRPARALGIQQIKGYEPGDADWGVKLEDVRGQAEAKEEITRVVSLWQSGEEFEKAGGKRERGVLFLGPPGTGKTMLSKAIATSFNCPFVTIPGSGFAQTFIGMDAVIVRFLARKAKKLAAKWGGQCIVFIDEIDAVGMRRQPLGSGLPAVPRRLDPRPPVLRPERRADARRRPAARDARVARPAVRDARRAAARGLPGDRRRGSRARSTSS